MNPVLWYLLLMVLLIFGGTWIGFAIGFAGAVGLWQTIGERMFSVVATFAWQSTTGFTLSAIPLFILMGDVIYYSGLTSRLFSGISKLITGLPGNLLQGNVVAATLFAATSGSSVASAAALGPMTYVEEVEKRGYNEELVLGSLAAGGTLGILIPPSIIFILYGVATDNSIGQLFLAGLIPGLALAGLFMLYIGIRCSLQPHLVPATETYHAMNWRTRLIGLAEAWPFLVLAAAVLGTIYGGIATPTEAAGVGATVAFIMAFAFGEMNRERLVKTLTSTVRTTSMIFLILIAANVMSMVLTYYNVPVTMRNLASDLGRVEVTLMLIVLYLALGMFFDAISMMILTLPFVMPIIEAAGLDPIWFGVLLVVLIEAGLLTPPVGLNLFVIQGTTGASLGRVIAGSMPFVGIQLLLVTLLIIFPQLATWLPQRMIP